MNILEKKDLKYGENTVFFQNIIQYISRALLRNFWNVPRIVLLKYGITLKVLGISVNWEKSSQK